MVEVNKTYDLLPGVDEQSYFEHARIAIRKVLRAPGIVEIRCYRSLLSPPRMRLAFVWQTLSDWAKFAESPERRELEGELLKFATSIDIELWRPSPVVPETVRPEKPAAERHLTASKMDFGLTWD